MQTANFEIALQPRAADDLIFPNNAYINTVPKLLQNHRNKCSDIHMAEIFTITQCVVNLRGLANTLYLNATYIWVLKFYRLIRSTKMSGETFLVAQGVQTHLLQDHTSNKHSESILRAIHVPILLTFQFEKCHKMCLKFGENS